VNQLGGECRQAIILVGIASFDDHVAAFEIIQLVQALAERRQVIRGRRSSCAQPSNNGRGLLLRARRERPRSCCAAECEYEFSPSDVGCHATLRWGSFPCNRGTISRFSERTNNAFAVRKSEAANVSVGCWAIAAATQPAE